MAENVVRVLNVLGADRDLLDTTDGEALLELLQEYFVDSEGSHTPIYHDTDVYGTLRIFTTCRQKPTFLETIIILRTATRVQF